MSENIIMVDGDAHLFRYFYGQNSEFFHHDLPAGGVKGSLKGLQSLVKTLQAKHLIVMFDHDDKKTFRHLKFPEYKVGRPPRPDELRAQKPIFMEALSKIGIRWHMDSEVEADDLLISMGVRAKKFGFNPIVVTRDKDSMEFANSMQIYNAQDKVFFTPEYVQNKFGVAPEKIPDLLCLMNDNADNIQGIEGCGVKTGAKWINAFGSLEGVLANIGDPMIAERFRKQLVDKANQLVFFRNLMRLRSDVPGLPMPQLCLWKDFDMEEACKNLDWSGLESVYEKRAKEELQKREPTTFYPNQPAAVAPVVNSAAPDADPWKTDTSPSKPDDFGLVNEGRSAINLDDEIVF